MKIQFYIITLLLFIYTCDHQLVDPMRDNPFDTDSDLVSDDPFNLQTQNLSDHILISWNYNSDQPVLDSCKLYRVNALGVETLLFRGLYSNTKMTYVDPDVVWDSTYYYFVNAIINKKETPPPELDEVSPVMRRIYVGGSDGDFNTINNALDSLSGGVTIYVKDGTYYENIDFKGKAITLRSENGPENTIIDGNHNGAVITMDNDENENSILYGFTIRNGENNKGGGIHIDDSSPIIRNCIIENNSANSNGGGIYLDRSFALIDSCIIRNNSAEKGGGVFTTNEDGLPIFQNCEFTGNNSIGGYPHGDGGGVYVDRTDATLTQCTFQNNAASDDGGGLYLRNVGSVHVENGSFISNNSVDKGGAIYIERGRGNSTIINTIFSNNFGKNGGGAIYSEKAAPTITYSTFWKNSVDSDENSNGGAIYCEDGSAMTILNSILWDNIGNEDSQIYFEPIVGDTLFTIDYSDIENGQSKWWFGEHCIDLDPNFENPTEGDFHLQSNSPCIGTDENGTEMGVYGGTIE